MAASGAVVVRSVRCRNPMLAGAVGALLGFTAWAASFVFAWWWTVRGIQNPVGFFGYLPRRAEVGFSIGRSGGGMPITGGFVYALWIVEGLILVIGTMLPMRREAKKPFCESCAKWGDTHKLSFEVARPSQATVEMIEKAKELTALVPDPSKKEEPGPEGTRLMYNVLGCPACGGVDHLNVDFYYWVMENKQPKEKKKRLQGSILVGAEELDAIRAYAGTESQVEERAEAGTT